MAAPVAVGHTETFDAGGTTCVITLTAGVPVGAKLFVLCGNNVGSATISSVVDSRSNSYATDVSATSTNLSGCFLLRSDVATALLTNDTITVTFGQSTTNRLGSASYKTGLVTGGPDKTATGASAGIVTAAGWSSGVTATTTQPDEFAIGGVVDNDSTLVTSVVVSPNVEITDAGTSDGVSLVLEYQDLTATGTPKIDGTFSIVQSKQWNAGAATYKLVLGGGPTAVRPSGRNVGPMALRQKTRRRFRLPWATDAAVATNYNDSSTGTLTLSGTRTETHAHTASAAGTLTLSGTRAETHAHTSSAAGTLTFSGTRTESQAHTSSASGTLTLSGTRTETHAHTRSGAGTLTFTGTRDNVLNGTFESNITGWSVVNFPAGISRDTAEFHSGVASLKVSQALISDGAVSDFIPGAIPGLTSVLTCWVKVPSGQQIEFDLNGSPGGFLDESLLVTGTGAWQLATLPFTPTVQTSIAIQVVSSAFPTPIDFWIDDVVLSYYREQTAHTSTAAGTITFAGTATENYQPPGGSTSTPVRTLMGVGT